jgi:hypothetical protein
VVGDVELGFEIINDLHNMPLLFKRERGADEFLIATG